MTRPVRVVRRHDDLSDDPYHEMVWLGDSLLRDALGRSHAHAGVRWAKVVCNNPDCHALVLVSARPIEFTAALATA